jgi:hypothetical protein
MEPMTVVVLGMHSSGTSMVAGILHALGVDMHPSPSGKVRHYKTNEDADFFRLNVQILARSRGDWLRPPTRGQVLETKAYFDHQIAKLVEAKDDLRDAWGFKDPRTCLTAWLYHEHLRNPMYIRVVRDHDATAASMMRRNGKSDLKRWVGLSEEYCGRADEFLDEVDAPVLRVYSERLFRKGESAGSEIGRIAKFIGMEAMDKDIKNALSTIIDRKDNKPT